MTGDTWVSLALLAGCALAGWWFFRWDHRMILRDREKLNSLFPLVGYKTLAGRPNSHASDSQGPRRPLRDDNLGGGAITLRDRILRDRILRDRIADVIENTICGHWEEGYGLTVADAVIAELGLEREDWTVETDMFVTPPSVTKLELECIICNRSYTIRSDTPGWASVRDLCPDCWLEDGER